jgi:hypothetical protein
MEDLRKMAINVSKLSKLFWFAVSVGLLSSFALSSASIDFTFGSSITSSVAVPSSNFADSILVLLAIFAILIGVAIAIKLRKHIKIIALAVAVLIVIIAGVGAVWYSEATINYWLISPYSTGGQDNPLTVNCQNTGHLPGTFDLQLSFTNAHFSYKTNLPYNLVDSGTVKFTFTLNPGETQSREVWFIIDNNVTDFYISLSFQQSGGNFFVRSGSGGVDSVSYQKDTSDANFTMRLVSPPP